MNADELVPGARHDELGKRKEKRFFRQQMGSQGPLYDAYCQGEYAAYRLRRARNPYPPGRRHDEWQRGFDLADPMGDWQGRNL